MGEDKYKKKIISAILCLLFIIGGIPFDFIGPIKAEAIAKEIDDSFLIEKIADGTHNGEGTETFINSKNGYKVADDTIDDGVVASRDVVVYKYRFSVSAGEERTVRLKLDIEPKDSALEIGDFEKAGFSSPIIDCKWDEKTGEWVFKIPAGSVAFMEGTFNISAKDTKGDVNRNNKVIVSIKGIKEKELKKDSSLKREYYLDKVIETEPVTVVSIPLADLTIDGNTRKNRVYDFHDTLENQGEFLIEPTRLFFEGYSRAGLSQSGRWHTDVDVSGFPQGTTWKLDGKEVIPKNNILKDLWGEGSAKLSYTLPKNMKIEATENFIVQLLPREDSFAVGNMKNVLDPGTGKGKDYGTYNYKINGKYANAVAGVAVNNNNFGVAVWRYSPNGDVWDYDVFVPRDKNYSLFEDPNIYWSKEKDWYNQGEATTDLAFYKKTVTNDNDMYSNLHFIVEKTKGANPNRIVLGDTWDQNRREVKKGYKLVESKYDSKRSVVVKKISKDGHEEIISPQLYTVQWRKVPNGEVSLDDNVSGATAWIESDQAPNEDCNQYRVIFKEEAYSPQDDSLVEVYVPVKALDNYVEEAGVLQLIRSYGAFTIQEDDTAKGVLNNTFKVRGDEGRDQEINTVTRDQVIAIPNPPVLNAYIKDLVEKMPKAVKEGHRYAVNVKVVDRVKSIPKTTGYRGRRVITFDPIYDISTLTYEQSGGWVLESVDKEKNQAIFRNDDLTLTYDDEDRLEYIYSMGDIFLHIKTIPNLKYDSKVATGSIKEDVSLTYPQIGTMESDTIVRDTAITYPFETSLETYAEIEAKSHLQDVGGLLEYKAQIGTAENPFSQDIILPYNGDIKLVDKLNQSNGTEIKIDKNTGENTNKNIDFNRIGRSKISKSYKIEKIKVSQVGKDATLLFVDENNKEIKLNFDENGDVDISPIKNRELGNKEVRIRVSTNSRPRDNQGFGAVVDITLVPTVYNPEDAYVMWLDSTRKYNSKELLESGTKMPWPDYIKVTKGSISGCVWYDSDGSGTINDGETKLGNVTVELYKSDEMGNYTLYKNQIVKTSGDGKYTFDNLPKGKYKVSLANVHRDVGKDNKIKIVDGITKDGDLNFITKNRFKVDEITTQTFSYPSLKNQYADSKAEVEINIGQNIKNVNFGFLTHKSDLILDKSIATVKEEGNKATVEWDVTIENTGSEPIENPLLFDKMSNSLYNVRAYSQVSKEISKKTWQGEFLGCMPYLPSEPLDKYKIRDDFNGNSSKYIYTSGAYRNDNASGENQKYKYQYFFDDKYLACYDFQYGYIAYSKDYVYIYDVGYGNSLIKPEYRNDPETIKEFKKEDKKSAPGIRRMGNFIKQAEITDIRRYEKNSYTLVAPFLTTKGVYVILGTPVDDPKNKKIDKIKYTVEFLQYSDRHGKGLDIVAGGDYSPYNIAMLTDKGYIMTWVCDRYDAKSNNLLSEKTRIFETKYNNDKIVKFVSDFELGIAIVQGKSGKLYFFQPYTYSNGNYDVNQNPITPIDDITGSNVKVSKYPWRNSDNRMIATSNGIWNIQYKRLFEPNRVETNVVKVSDIGNVAGISEVRKRTGGDLSFYTSDNKIYHYDTHNPYANAKRIYLQADLSDKIKNISYFYDKDLFVDQDNRLWRSLRKKVPNGAINYFDISNTLQLEGKPKYIRFDDNYSATVATDKELRKVDVYAPTGEINDTILDGDVVEYTRDIIMPVEEQLSTKKNDWNLRKYSLEKIKPKEKKQIHFVAEVNRKEKDFVVGNQAWATSQTTPRENLFINSDGMPGNPILPEPKDFHPEGIFACEGGASKQVVINKDLGKEKLILENGKVKFVEESINKDDLADQTPALIRGIDEMPEYTGLAGFAWHDKDKDGIRNDDSPAKNIKVSILNKNYQVVGETTTDDKGYWSYKELDKNETYYVSYYIDGYKVEDKLWTATKKGAKPENLNSDINKEGMVSQLVSPRKIGNDGSIETGYADAGLIAQSPSIKLIKGQIHFDGTKDDEDTVKGNKSLSKDTKAVEKMAVVDGSQNFAGRVEDGDKDPRTQGYSFKIVNNGSLPLKNIAFSDETIEGNKAVFTRNLKKYNSQGKLLDDKVSITEEGDKYICKDSDNKGTTLEVGDYLVGVFDIPFTEGKDKHRDRITVSGDAFDEDKVVATVTDKDGLYTKYVYDEPKFITLGKYGVSHTEELEDANKREILGGVKFDIDKVENPEAPKSSYQYKNIGRYITGVRGTVDIKLDVGTYRIREVSTPLDYIVPEGDGWFVTLDYNKDGSIRMVTSAESTMPYFVGEANKNAKVNSWGELSIANYKKVKLPITGGRSILIFALIGSVLIIFGLYLATRNRRK